jgi:hypothetical protein
MKTKYIKLGLLNGMSKISDDGGDEQGLKRRVKARQICMISEGRRRSSSVACSA